MKSRKARLHHKVGSLMIDKGVWMAPLSKTDGSLMWSKFDKDPTSHVLMIYAPSRRNKIQRFLSSLRTFDGIQRIDLDGGIDSPAEMRRKIQKASKSIRKASINDQGPTLITIHDVTGLYRNLRRDSTRMALEEDLESLIHDGPNHGVHLMVIQESNDRGLAILARLGLNADTGVVVGPITPMACELAFGHQVSAACTKHGSRIGWAYTNKGGMTGLVNLDPLSSNASLR